MRIVLTLFILFTSKAIYAQNIGCGFGYIPEAEIQHGCGCHYYTSTNTAFKLLMQSRLGYEEPKMYINNNLVDMQVIDVELLPDSPSVGDNFSQQYSFGEFEMMFYNTVMAACSTSTPGCEVTTLSTNVVLKHGSCILRLNNIKGNCGC